MDDSGIIQAKYLSYETECVTRIPNEIASY
jgi:hypothetical protein